MNNIENNTENTQENKLKKIKQIINSPQGKELGTYLLFLLLSASIWLIFAINDNKEINIQIPLELVDIPRDVVMLQDLPPYIEARIRDKGPAIINYDLNGIDKIEINFDRHKNTANNTIVINSNTLIEYTRKQLRATTSILSFPTDSLKVSYTQDPGKKVPIVINGTITPSPHSTMSNKIYTIPDSATIYAQKHTLDNITEVYTEKIKINNISDTTHITVGIAPIANTRILPDSITIVAPIEEYVMKKLTVPVAIGGIPYGYSIMTFPSNITLTCLVPKSKYASIVSEDFLVGNTFSQIQKTPGSYGYITAVNAPPYVHNIMLSQDSIEYIINENIINTTTDTTTTQP